MNSETLFVLLDWVNRISAVVIILLITKKVILRSKDLQHFIAVLCTVGFLHFLLDSILQIASAMWFGRLTNIYVGLTILSNPGWKHTVYVICSIIIRSVILMAMLPILRKINGFSSYSSHMVMILSLCAGSLSGFMMNLILMDSKIGLQLTVLLSWLLLIVFVISLIWGLSSYGKFHEEQARREYLQNTGAILEKSYITIANKNHELEKQAHDFVNQLKVIRRLPAGEVAPHIDNLLQTTIHEKTQISTGDPYIDAVLSVKMEEANQKQTHLTYRIALPQKMPFSSGDLCTILANLLDNAIEASEKIADPHLREIEVTMDQKGYFYAIIVRNRIDPTSLDLQHPLQSRKEYDGKRHGLGIQNIKDSARNYHGVYTYEIDHDFFIANVVLESRAA